MKKTTRSRSFMLAAGFLLGTGAFTSMALAAEPNYVTLGTGTIDVKNGEELHLQLDGRDSADSYVGEGRIIVQAGSWSNSLTNKDNLAVNPLSGRTKYTLTFQSLNGNRSFHRRLFVSNGTGTLAEISCGLSSADPGGRWVFRFEKANQAFHNRGYSYGNGWIEFK